MAVPLPKKADFRQTALASGLVSEDEIEAAVQQLKEAAEEGQRAVSDQRLADQLVESSLLNAWQAEQLLSGRTKWTLGSYQIIDAIGQGGMGQVFKAEHSLMRRIVAIKVLPLSKSTPEAIANFAREIQAQAQLDHENLVRAYDAGQDGSVHFLVTEYVPGVDLRRLIKRNGRLTAAAAAALIAQAAKGLAYAHSKGLIHRDIKPGNLLVTPEGICKVSDLGLAGFLNSEDESDNRRNRTVGTADYLSPEQVQTPHKLTPSSDIYSLGCTLYYAVTGKVPFPGGSTRDKARAHCNDQPIDPRRINTDLNEDFVNIIAQMMVKDPQQRLRSAEEVIETLAPWAGQDWAMSVASGVANATSSTRSRSGPPPLPSIPRMSDTKPIPEVGGKVDSPSQVSEATHPLASASDETMTVYDTPPGQPEFVQPTDGLSLAVLVAVWLGVSAAIAVVGAIIYHAVN